MRPDFYNVLVEHASSTRGFEIDAQRFGRWLRSIQEQVHDGYRIVVAAESSGHGNRWKLEKV